MADDSQINHNTKTLTNTSEPLAKLFPKFNSLQIDKLRRFIRKLENGN